MVMFLNSPNIPGAVSAANARCQADVASHARGDGS
jgi:hypothetical protein